jgi:class 3 adenylate cyclase
MAALIFDSPAFTHTFHGPGDRGRHQFASTGTGDTSADKVMDHGSTAGGSRIAMRGVASGALSMPAQCKDFARATVIKGAFHATFVAGETTQAAVLFADMRGYTGLAERLPCARVVPLLDEFLTILGRITVTFGGEVFHTAGDGMMAGFGVGYPRRSIAGAAIAAGGAMLQHFAPLATRWWEEFEVITGLGIGLDLGEVALGFLGPPDRKALTMIGDTANVAGRLCRRARAGEMLFSCAVATALVADGDRADVANWWISGAYRRQGSSIENTQFDRADFAESPSLPLPGRIPACYPPAGPMTSVDHSL